MLRATSSCYNSVLAAAVQGDLVAFLHCMAFHLDLLDRHGVGVAVLLAGALDVTRGQRGHTVAPEQSAFSRDPPYSLHWPGP